MKIDNILSIQKVSFLPEIPLEIRSQNLKFPLP
jgi:hypothetical protein